MANRSLKDALRRKGETVGLTDQPQTNWNPSTHAEMIAAGWKRFNVLLPPDEHEAFKIASIKEGQDMAAITRHLIQDWLAKKHS